MESILHTEMYISKITHYSSVPLNLTYDMFMCVVVLIFVQANINEMKFAIISNSVLI